MIWGTSTCTLTSLIECEIGFCFSDHCFIFFFVCTMLIFLFLSVSSVEDSMFNSRSSGQAVAFDPLQFTNFSKVVYIYSTVILFEWYYLCQHWGLIWMYPRTQAITILKIWQKFFLWTCTFGHHMYEKSKAIRWENYLFCISFVPNYSQHELQMLIPNWKFILHHPTYAISDFHADSYASWNKH